jgi:cyclohexadienyl dehydratase
LIKNRQYQLCRLTFIWLFLAACSSASADEQRLFGLINERLSYMDEVAAYKWINGLPIEDLEREAIVIDRAVIAGLAQGIRTENSKNFFLQQINAAKEIQGYWFAYWKTNTAPARAPDLIKVVRPELIRLGNAITKELGTLHGTRITDVGFQQSIEIEGLSLAGEQSLYEALTGIRFYDHRLEQILHAGILRVGTTGDYAPFSYQRDSNADVTGIDIDLARDLASALNVKLHFTKTSWPTLMHDLNAGTYDIAMSGVSRNLDRQKEAYFSIAYHKGGKTPITLCKNINRFNDLKKIDKKSTNIIVNPGGTNERYVDSHIHHAKKIIHPDNRTIFEEIINGHADLMITDSIEVQLKSSQHEELCAAMPEENLTYLDKGYLMPQDEKLKEYVDLWLTTRLADGTVESIFKKHLN